MKKDRLVISTIGLTLLLFTFGLFCWKSSVSLDPDFGYRLRNGIEIPIKGIPKVDPYSYTMASFPYVEHAWLTAVGMAFIYTNVGYLTLAAVTTLMVVLSLIIAASRTNLKNPVSKPYLIKYWHFGNIFFILAVATILNFTGIRAQVISWLMVSLLVYFLFNETLWKKVSFFTPIYFLLWANLHGSFAAGLSIYFIVLTLRFVRIRKIDTTEVWLFLISAMMTLINPYGPGVWREVWSSVTDSSLRWRISEWMPAIFVTDLSFASYLTISITMIWKYRRKYNLEEIGLYFFVLLQALASARHVPIWIIVSISPASKAIDYLYEDVNKIEFATPRFKKVYFFAIIGSLLIFVYGLFFAARNAHKLSEEIFYPKDAVFYLKQNEFKGNLFSEYGWGGYLIWKYPDQKLFIDGRMPSWRQINHPPEGTESAFDDYIDITTGKKDYKIFFDKYEIKVVLWPKEEITIYSLIGKKLDKFLEKFGKEHNDFELVTQLESDGWEKVYEDEVSVILVGEQ